MESSGTPLSPTARTTLRRNRTRAERDRYALVDVLDAARICHLGVMVHGTSLVVPTAFAYDLDGPDREGTLYLHGSERDVALALIVDKVVAGRAALLRPNTRKELAATRVLAVALYEASVKTRTGGPVDDDEDVAAGGVWAGVLPVTERIGSPVPAADLDAAGAVHAPR
ncbi:pyridoxamine 5'-phosphate oxidase family protein [Rhodococcoides kroppenstedtii]|uniref:pyridoxamine 5'-phosphate oxidase family protein n=1 Tax=Rhodococcoides kroppenstedtii TaxID=293050 RepID=UPI0036385D95